MRTLEDLPLDFPSLGWSIASWIEYFCIHGPGSVQGQDVLLIQEELRFLAWAYRLDETGRRVVTDADLSKPKGFRKSEFAGWLSLAEALAPVRFSHWAEKGEVSAWGYEYEEGEPVGRPVVYPFVRILATEESQSGNTYDNVSYNLKNSAVLNATYAYDFGRSAETSSRVYIHEPGGGEIVPSTSGSSSKDGGKETFVVADEVHLYFTPQLRDMYDTVERNCRKRKLDEPWILRTTTMFQPGQNSVAEMERKSFEEVGADVERAVTELGLLVDHSEAPEDTDIEDDDALRAALEYVYGEASAWVDIENIIRVQFRRRKDKVAEACRYYLNQRVKGTGRWRDIRTFDILKVTAKYKPGDALALGFDGSRKLDATVLMGCRISDGLLIPLGWWERPARLQRWEDWEVPSDEVHHAVYTAFSTYRVWFLYADPPFWRDEVDAWAGQWPDKVKKFETAKAIRMVHAVDLAEQVIDQGQVRWNEAPELLIAGKNPQLRTHISNAYTRDTRVKLDEQRYGHVVTKETRDSTDHVDGAVSSVLAIQGRAHAIAKGALRQRRKKRTLNIS